MSQPIFPMFLTKCILKCISIEKCHIQNVHYINLFIASSCNIFVLFSKFHSLNLQYNRYSGHMLHVRGILSIRR